MSNKKLTPIQQALIAEYKRRGLHLKDRIHNYRVERFLAQNNYLEARNRSRYRAALCTRRAGKSMGEAIDCLEIGTQFPNSRMVYGGLTVSTVFGIIWDIFLELDEKYKIGIKPVKSDYKIIMPNKTEIQLFGLDASEKQMRKILGRKLRKAVIDEAGSITTGLEKIIKQAINPTLTDLRPNSWLSLIGTPENLPNTYFERVTTGTDIGMKWDVHKWTAYDNPFVKDQWTVEIDEMMSHNPLVVNTSWFKTHYLGEWCVDDEMVIIHFNKELNYVDKFDKIPGVDWYYILGIDIGFNDDSSFSVLATSPFSPKTYILESFKKKEMDFTDVAETIKAICARYPIDFRVIDGANKQGVQEIINRHKIQLESAEKIEKNIHLRLMDDDLKMGKVVALRGKNDELVEEWDSLVWKNEMKDAEDPRCSNHLSDSTLYAWRKSLHFVGSKLEIKHPLTSPEQQVKWEKEEIELLLSQKEDESFLW